MTTASYQHTLDNLARTLVVTWGDVFDLVDEIREERKRELPARLLYTNPDCSDLCSHQDYICVSSYAPREMRVPAVVEAVWADRLRCEDIPF
jgi:hypothetical protein